MYLNIGLNCFIYVKEFLYIFNDKRIKLVNIIYILVFKYF